MRTVIKEYGYVSNNTARTLRSSASHTVGLILPNINNDFFSSIAVSIEQYFDFNDYALFICNTDNDPQKERRYFHRLDSMRVDGIIVISCQKEIEAGILSREEADQDERKNVIIKALGAEPTVEPDFFQVEVKKGDILLACSDGLYDEVSDEEIVEIIKEKDNMNELAAELIARANRNGGRDNITIITLQITEEEIDE